MDGDQQLNFTTLIEWPLATLYKFIGQHKFAGKPYMKIERLESEQRPGKQAFKALVVQNLTRIFRTPSS